MTIDTKIKLLTINETEKEELRAQHLTRLKKDLTFSWKCYITYFLFGIFVVILGNILSHEINLELDFILFILIHILSMSIAEEKRTETIANSIELLLDDNFNKIVNHHNMLIDIYNQHLDDHMKEHSSK